VRTAVRAVVLHGDRVLVQRAFDEPCYAFIGGEYETGDTFEERTRREFEEETTARVTSWRYLFVVENRFMSGERRVHALEHFVLVTLDRQDVHSREAHLVQEWLPLKDLRDVDLRPFQVRDVVADGTFDTVRHLVADEWVGLAEDGRPSRE
jgi:ADP-ribose pyrophosphatase YjhB (NUDIX family)